MWFKLKISQLAKKMNLQRIIIILGLLCLAPGYSEEVPAITKAATVAALMAGGQFVYYYHGESLHQSLSIFARSNGLKAVFVKGEEGKIFNKPVVGRFVVADNTALLNTLGSRYNFEWFIYSGTVYFTSTQIVNRSINVTSDAFQVIKANLQQIGLLNSKFSYSEITSENKIIVSGPAAYVDLVINQIKNLNISSDRQQYVVYRLKYANAVDTQLFFNKQVITIPGVVTILQNLASAKTGTGSMVNNVSEFTQSATNGVAKASDSGTTGSSSPPAGGVAPSGGAAGDGGISTSGGQVDADNSIQADPRTNSVILISNQARINLYKNLIDKMDVPSILVQVDVTVVHLSQQALDQMGVNWTSLLGNGGAIGSTTSGAKFSAVNPGDIFVANLNSFGVKVNALAGDGLAEVTSKPSLVTENNLPAILNVSETLYTNMPNGLSNYGQLSNGLQITPHVVFEKNGEKLIRLAIVLNDGTQGEYSDAAGTSLIQSTLTSQAVINEGQSILLAGHSVNSKIKKETKIPILGDIPILGWLFKSSSTSLQKMTTVFLITPRILWAPSGYSMGGAITIDGRKIDTSTINSRIIVKPTGN